MKTEDKTTVEHKPMIGGKRPGSGRKALDKDGTIVITARLTGEQKATYEMLGGAKWLRHQLELFAQG